MLRLFLNNLIHQLPHLLRWNIYEHNGGEVDEKYITESDDKSLKVKKKISEDKDSVQKTIDLIRRLGENFNYGFHSIFPLL